MNKARGFYNRRYPVKIKLVVPIQWERPAERRVILGSCLYPREMTWNQWFNILPGVGTLDPNKYQVEALRHRPKPVRKGLNTKISEVLNEYHVHSNKRPYTVYIIVKLKKAVRSKPVPMASAAPPRRQRKPPPPPPKLTVNNDHLEVDVGQEASINLRTIGVKLERGQGALGPCRFLNQQQRILQRNEQVMDFHFPAENHNVRRPPMGPVSTNMPQRQQQFSMPPPETQYQHQEQQNYYPLLRSTLNQGGRPNRLIKPAQGIPSGNHQAGNIAAAAAMAAAIQRNAFEAQRRHLVGVAQLAATASRGQFHYHHEQQMSYYSVPVTPFVGSRTGSKSPPRWHSLGDLE